MDYVNKKINMKAVCFSSGKLLPIKWQIFNDGKEQVIKIDNIMGYEERNIYNKAHFARNTGHRGADVAYLYYYCESEINGLMRDYVLKYNLYKHSWWLHKI